MNETINARLLNADAVPCLTTVRDRLSDSWFAHEKNPTIIEAANCEKVIGNCFVWNIYSDSMAKM